MDSVVIAGPTRPRVPWPDGIRCPVILHFDVDAESIYVALDPDNARRPVTHSQGTYGPRLGVPRLLALLGEYDLKASFYFPGISAERHPYALEAIVAAGHEIGVHNYTHRRPDSLSLAEEEEEIGRAIEVLERMSGQKMRGYVSPAWEYSENTLALLRRHGLRFACDAMDEDIPYYVHVDGEPTDFVQLPMHWSLDDGPLYLFGLLPPMSPGGPYVERSRVLELWTTELEALHEEGAYVHLALHPFLSGRAARVKTLEHFIRFALGLPGIRFCTTGEVYDMYTALIPPERGKPGSWFPAEGSPAPQVRKVDGVPMFG
jgi:peptidoglycan/xylan/chitin deacetylase (PgdA/CDA1 family)